nr:MAG TPA: hypothetical protein [Caudoviricetes sp.]
MTTTLRVFVSRAHALYIEITYISCDCFAITSA